jgi:hypothetical protein
LEIVVSKLLDIACYSSVDMAWLFVVFQVLVVSEDCDRERRTQEKVAVIG